MSTLSRIKKDWGEDFCLPENLWSRFENVTAESLEELIACMEFSVSNGWMGLAAEISDFIQISADDLLADNYEMRLRVEIERLKRLSYLGFEQATRAVSERILNLIQSAGDSLQLEDRLVWESVAVGAHAWFETNPAELQKSIDRCMEIDRRFEGETTLRAVCLGFAYALEGHLGALLGDLDRCNDGYRKAVQACRRRSLSNPLAHILIHHAESLALLKRWDNAAGIARKFLDTASNQPKKQFRSHLLLRAIILLLSAPHDVVTPEEFKYNAFRYHILIHATGLAPSQNVYPLLEKARKKIIERRSNPIELYHLDWRSELRHQIMSLGDRDFERLIRFMHESSGFRVEDLPGSFPSFDLVAISQTADGTEHVLGIQVKANRTTDYPKKEIKDELVYDNARAWLAQLYGIDGLSQVHWYTINKLEVGAYRLLQLRIKSVFGKACELKAFDLDDLVNILLDKPEILKRVVFGSEWKE